MYPKVIESFANVCFALIQDNFLCVTIFVNYYLVTVITDSLASIFLIVLWFFYRPSDFCRGTDYEVCVAIFITLRVVLALLVVFADIMQVFNDFRGVYFHVYSFY